MKKLFNNKGIGVLEILVIIMLVLITIGVLNILR